MAELTIRFKKNKDGSAALTCIRSDGSATWQRQEGKLGAVFPPHDLTHYAVESALGYSDGFFGLIAKGWEIGDFASPWPRGQPGDEAREVEALVAFFDADRTQGVTASTEAFNERAAAYMDSRSHDPRRTPFRPLTSDEIAGVRAVRAEMLSRWAALAQGETLVIRFEPGG